MERRQCPRVDLALPVDAQLRVQALPCRTADVSETGAALVTRDPVQPGTQFRLHWSFDTSHRADVDAVVVRCEPARIGFVWGVRFSDPLDGKDDLWSRFREAKLDGSDSVQLLSPASSSTDVDAGLRELYLSAVQYVDRLSSR